MLAYPISQTQLDHLADKVGHHMRMFTEVGSICHGRVELDDVAESGVFHLLLKPIVTIDLRVHVQCFWDHAPNHLKDNCFWDCLSQLS